VPAVERRPLTLLMDNFYTTREDGINVRVDRLTEKKDRVDDGKGSFDEKYILAGKGAKKGKNFFHDNILSSAGKLGEVFQ